MTQHRRSSIGLNSQDATAPEKSAFNLASRIDQLQWNLDDVSMKDVHRKEIDKFLGDFLADAFLASDKKKRRKQIIYQLKRRWKLWLRRFRRGKKNKKPQVSEGPIPMVVYLDPDENVVNEMMCTTIEMVTSPKLKSTRPTANQQEADAVQYYLHGGANIAKPPTFFQTLKEDLKSPHKSKKHRRMPTDETLRVDASLGTDLFSSIDDDIFSDQDLTGLEADSSDSERRMKAFREKSYRRYREKGHYSLLPARGRASLELRG